MKLKNKKLIYDKESRLGFVSGVLLCVALLGCGDGLDDTGFGEDEDGNISGIADYGKTDNTIGSSTLDPEVEEFWATIDEARQKLPLRLASRLSQNLKELRARFDRETAEVVLPLVNRMIAGGDLAPQVEEVSFELALLLEQKAGEELLEELGRFLATSAGDMPSYLETLETERPEDIDQKIIEDEEEIIAQFAASPEIKPKAGNYTSLQMVIIKTPTENAIIHYTLDGTEPNQDSPVYTEPFEIGREKEHVPVRAIAYREGLTESGVVNSSYNVVLPKVETPQASVEPGVYNQNISVQVDSPTLGVQTHYTLDGSTPTKESPLLSEAFEVLSGETLAIKVRSFKDLMRPSPVLVAEYRVDTLAPVVPTGSLVISELKPTGFDIDWQVAVDDYDAVGEVFYRIAVSETAASFATLAQTLAYIENPPGQALVSGYVLGRETRNFYHAYNLNPSTSYFVTIIAEDSAGNVSQFEVIGATTTLN